MSVMALKSVCNLLSRQCGLLTCSSNVMSISLQKMCDKPLIKTVEYCDVKALKDNLNVLLIDVREPVELQQTGILPGSINIPVGQVESTLRDIPPKEFLMKYGRSKPDFDFPLVFSCRSGKRSLDASKIAVRLGFKNVGNYGGGWLDWEKSNK